jgi:hypothetical protein
MDEITKIRLIIFATACVIVPVVFILLNRYQKRMWKDAVELIARKEAALDDQLNNRPFRIVRTALGKYRIQQFVGMDCPISYDWMFVSEPGIPKEGYTSRREAEQAMHRLIKEFLDARKARADRAEKARAEVEHIRKNNLVEQIICNPTISQKMEGRKIPPCGHAAREPFRAV